jgi:hypothetical protein
MYEIIGCYSTANQAILEAKAEVGRIRHSNSRADDPVESDGAYYYQGDILLETSDYDRGMNIERIVVKVRRVRVLRTFDPENHVDHRYGDGMNYDETRDYEFEERAPGGF